MTVMSKEILSRRWLLIHGAAAVATLAVTAGCGESTPPPKKDEYGSGHLHFPSSDGIQLPPELDTVSEILATYKVGDTLTVTHEDGNTYVVEKTSASGYKVVSVVGEEKKSIWYPASKKTIPVRAIIAVQ